MDVRQGDIYWVEIPEKQTEGAEQFGRRPFIVVSRNNVNKSIKTVVVVPMSTKNIQNQPPFRIVIPLTEIIKAPSCTSQLSISVAKTDQVRVIDKSRLEQKIGQLSRAAIISVCSVGIAFVFDIR